MATHLREFPKGKPDLAKLKPDAMHAIEMYESGKETLLSHSRVDLEDGTHLTVFHHKAS